MPASLEIKRKTPALASGMKDVCSNACKGRDTGRTRSPRWVALILGIPAALLCDFCAEEWKAMWEDAGGTASMAPKEHR